ncbi:hypothetical protein HMI56_005187 [Coelomomyces lativittatus]|nr:hypothetical protein HMI56_005187 [Coelomomyces lativittatus]
MCEVPSQMDITVETLFSNFLDHCSINLSALKKIENKVDESLNSVKNVHNGCLSLVAPEFERKLLKKDLKRRPCASKIFEKNSETEFLLPDKHVYDYSPASLAYLQNNIAWQCQGTYDFFRGVMKKLKKVKHYFTCSCKLPTL